MTTPAITNAKTYLKIHDDDDVLIDYTPGGVSDADFIAIESGAETINHTLGVVPFVRAWIDPAKDGEWHRGRKYLQSPYLTYVVTTTYLKLIVNSTGATFTNVPVHYKMYKEGDLAFSSAERIDKIIMGGTDSKTLSAWGGGGVVTATTTIAHGQTEELLSELTYSVDGGTTWKTDGTTSWGGSNNGFGISSSVDDTNLYIRYFSFSTNIESIMVRYTLELKT